MQLDPPADKSIITLWLGGVEPDMTEADIRAVIYPYGQIASFHLLRSAKCAFVEYVDREAAEGAAAQLYNALMVSGRSLSVNWARPKVQSGASAGGAGGSAGGSGSGSAAMLPPPGMERAPAAAYQLTGLPAPVTAWPPASSSSSSDDTAAAAGAGSSNSSSSNNNISSNKRPRDEQEGEAGAAAARPAKYAPVPPRGPPPAAPAAAAPKMSGLLSGLAAYGDDDDDDDAPAAAAIQDKFQVTQGRATNNKQAASTSAQLQYPSMNPSRLGAKV
jgi:RNA recognition motif-containing protein